MTERKHALQELRDKVASGLKYETMGHTVMCQKAFPKPDDFDGSRESYAKSEAQQSILVWRNGSLDAAKALHEAVLPGWNWDVGIDPPNHKRFMVRRFNPFKMFYAVNPDPARAWLLCILDALIAQASQ